MKIEVWDGTKEINDIDREHIAKMIAEGYTEGEICHEAGDEGEEGD